jgi:hypothetical protein
MKVGVQRSVAAAGRAGIWEFGNQSEKQVTRCKITVLKERREGKKEGEYTKTLLLNSSVLKEEDDTDRLPVSEAI